MRGARGPGTTVPVRMALFAAGLAAVFGAAFALGDAVDVGGGDAQAPTHAGDRHSADGAAAKQLRVVVDRDGFDPGVSATLAFRVLDGDGRPVEDFDIEHDRAMHLIAVRRDLTGYQHVHPRRAGAGRWEVEVAFPEAGPHRLFADFASGGRSYTLSADIDVTGDYRPRPLADASGTADAGGGYEVSLEKSASRRSFTVSKDGRAVDDIEPYLGARGHLVALREDDLAFQHVHPEDERTAGRKITFGVALPTPARYRMFLQFKHDGEIHTAAFTEDVRGDRGEREHGH